MAGVPDTVVSGDGTEPRSGDDFTSKVLRYGFGVSVDLNPESNIYVAPVVELVGWKPIGGFATGTADGTAAADDLHRGQGRGACEGRGGEAAEPQELTTRDSEVVDSLHGEGS